MQITSALQHLKKLRVLHRDVKPGNIILAAETGLAVLGDFGMAKKLDHMSAKAVTQCGTKGYTAPEVRQGQPGCCRWLFLKRIYTMDCDFF